MITYYSELKDIKSIINPIIDNFCCMRSSGFFNDGDSFITKKLYNKGRIFCEDSSSLFGIKKGYIKLNVSFPYNIKRGVIDVAKFSENKYMIWAVNMGLLDFGKDGIGAFFTKDGIQFSIKTSGGNYYVLDEYTNIESNTFFDIDFIWDSDGIKAVDSEPNLLIRINQENVVGGFVPIIDDNQINSSFYIDIGQDEPDVNSSFYNYELSILENSQNYNNLECSLKSIVIANDSYFFEEA
jgi:hypothetical protein